MCNSDQKLIQPKSVSERVVPDLSSFILHKQDIPLAPSCCLQCGVSVSGNHTTASQLPFSSGIQHQIDEFRLLTNPVWQMGSWVSRGAAGAHPTAGSGWSGGRSHPPNPAGRQQFLTLTPLFLSQCGPSPTFPLKAEHSCKSKTELLTSMTKVCKGNYFNDSHYNEEFSKQNHRLTGKVSPL